MEPLEFSIDIAAPRERVWEVLWDDETFRDWTSAFASDPAGARLQSDWEEGSRFEYFEGDAGSYGVIETLVPAEHAVFRHLGNLDSGVERPSKEGDRFLEEYRLEQAGDLTTLRLSPTQSAARTPGHVRSSHRPSARALEAAGRAVGHVNFCPARFW
jgi:uncharacterized protein YndB with AHSA1/START domain